MKSFSKIAANGHRPTHRLHGCAENTFAARKFFKCEKRDFGNHIIQCGFKACRGYAGDLIGKLIKRVTNGKKGGDFGNGKSGGF